MTTATTLASHSRLWERHRDAGQSVCGRQGLAFPCRISWILSSISQWKLCWCWGRTILGARQKIRTGLFGSVIWVACLIIIWVKKLYRLCGNVWWLFVCVLEVSKQLVNVSDSSDKIWKKHTNYYISVLSKTIDMFNDLLFLRSLKIFRIRLYFWCKACQV